MKRIRIYILAAICALTAVTACGCAADQKALSCGSRSITRGQFCYELAMEKSAILSDNGYSSDDPAIWTAVNSEGVSFSQISMQKLIRDESLKLYFADYAVSNGNGLTAEDKQKILDTMDSFAASLGGKSEFNNYMKDFGVNYNSVRDLMTTQYLSQKGQAMLYSKGSELEITDTKVKNFFKSDFASVRYVKVNNVNATYPNGKTIPLNAEQKAAADGLIAELTQNLTEENFDSFTPSSQVGFTRQSETQTFRRGSTGSKDYEEAVFSAKTGQIVSVQCSDGYYFFIRDKLDESWLTDERLAELKNSLASDSLDALYERIKDRISLNDAVINSFSFSDSKYFSS